MNIYLLSASPKILVEELADIHLEPTIEFGAQIINTVLHRVHGDGVDIAYDHSGARAHSIAGVQLMPPLWKQWKGRPNSTARWVDWAESDYRNFWWVFTLMWYTNKERTTRLKIPSHRFWGVINNWNVGGLFHKVVKPEGASHISPPIVWPVTKDILPFLSSPQVSPISAYVAYYSKILKGIKPKWTDRPVPGFWKRSDLII